MSVASQVVLVVVDVVDVDVFFVSGVIVLHVQRRAKRCWLWGGVDLRKARKI